MNEPLQLSRTQWQHITMGHANQPVSSEELTVRSKAGEVLVVDEYTGKRYRPVIAIDYGGGAESWRLQEI